MIAEKIKPATDTHKDHRVSYRFKAAEWQSVSADIDSSGMTCSDYLRSLALDAPVKRKVRNNRTNAAAKVCGRYLGVLGKLGSNHNQIARHFNMARSQGDPSLKPSNAEVMEAMERVELLLKEVRALLMQLVYPDNQ